MKLQILVLWVCCVLEFGCGFWVGQGTAHADANSYLAYLQDHHINTGLNPPAGNLKAGFYACEALHAGMTPEEVAVASRPMFLDVRGMIDAAQHELCPDTMGR